MLNKEMLEKNSAGNLMRESTRLLRHLDVLFYNLLILQPTTDKCIFVC